MRNVENSKNKSKINAQNRTTIMRVNVLRRTEQNILTWLMQMIPHRVALIVSTYIGFFGSLIVATSFVLATYLHVNYLLVSIPGFIVNWLGNSWGERLGSCKNGSRKWYKFLLDFMMDSIGVILVSIGFMIYVGSPFFLFGILLLLFYSWKRITSLLYRVIGEKFFYSEVMNSEQLKLLIAFMIIAELFFPSSIIYSAIFLMVILVGSNLINMRRLFVIAGDKDTNKDG